MSKKTKNVKKPNGTKPLVGRSIFVIQHKEKMLILGIFSTKRKADKYCNGSDSVAIQKLTIG